MATKGDQYEALTGNIWNYANRGDFTGVADALKKGVDVNIQNKAGWTAVHAAAAGGDSNMIKFLCDRGADLRLTDNAGRTAVHEASRNGHVECLRTLRKLGADFTAVSNRGETALQVVKGAETRRYLESILGEEMACESGKCAWQKAKEKAPPLPSSMDNPLQFKKGFSGKAKKEYLQWKRAQKRGKGEDSGEDEDWGEEKPSTAAPTAQGHHNNNNSNRGGRTGVAVPAMRASELKGQDGAGAGGVKKSRAPRGQRQDPSDATLPIIHVEDLQTVEGSSRRLPPVSPQEVGYTTEGLTLGMPLRPPWSPADSPSALHAQEEHSFRTWLESLTSRFPSSDRLSFFETNLEFWRQLWRVLERSDIVLMIVDCRNPLLHFSHALYRECTKGRGQPMILLLNKSDLVPAAAVEKWKEWFVNAYPNLTAVVAVSSSSDVVESARGVMEEILQCEIRVPGAEADSPTRTVASLVQMTAEDVLVQSKLRNLHSKKAKAQVILQEQLKHHQAASTRHPPAPSHPSHDEESEDGASSRAHGKGKDRGSKEGKGKARGRVTSEEEGRVKGSKGGGHSTHDEEEEGEDDWDVKGNKAKKKGYLKKQRQARMHRHEHEGEDGEEEEEGGDGSLPHMHATKPERKGNGRTSVEVDDSEGEDEVQGDDSDAVTESEESDDENDNNLFEALFEAAGMPHTSTSHKTSSSASSLQRPVVVCVVGEPNVGKSSTMNTLLGAHRVAVSSHPGRTKHYQTHVMVKDKLMLCDCPGVVFPKLDVALPVQVLFGCYPIARVRNPYAVIRYLAERLDPPLPVLLGLESERQVEWSPWSICEGLAEKHGWKSRRGGRLDVYRAANFILRTALAGKQRVVLAFLPPGGEPL